MIDAKQAEQLADSIAEKIAEGNELPNMSQLFLMGLSTAQGIMGELYRIRKQGEAKIELARGSEADWDKFYGEGEDE